MSAQQRPIHGVLALAQFIIALAAAAAVLLGHSLLGLALFAASLTLLALTDRYRFRNVVSVTLSVVNPRMLLLILAQLGGEAVVRARLLIRGRSSTRQRHHTSYTLPFERRWLVASGGSSWRTSHSWHLIGQRYAYASSQLTSRASATAPRADSRRTISHTVSRSLRLQMESWRKSATVSATRSRLALAGWIGVPRIFGATLS